MAGTGNRVVVVSVTKIESDIIESFVRHSLRFADAILMADNGSADGAAEILRRLQAEGLPLFVRRQSGVEFSHAETITELLQLAIAEHGADLVVPVDVDEFVVAGKQGTDVRQFLQALSPERVYSLELVQYATAEPYRDFGKHILACPCRREPPGLPGRSRKCIVGARAAAGHPIRLMQGGHGAYWEGAAGKKWLPLHALEELHLAHFHWRSEERYAVKSVLGWLGTVCKYTSRTPICAYMKDYYERIAAGKRTGMKRGLENLSESVDFGESDMPALRYGNLVRQDMLPLVLRECASIADAYAEAKALQRRRTVDVLLPYWGDHAALAATVKEAAKSTYPYITVYILDFTNGDRDFCQQITANICCHTCIYIGAQDGEDMAESLSEQATGDYVQYLLPGGEQTEEHLAGMVSAMDLQDTAFALYLLAKMPPISLTRRADCLDWCGEHYFPMCSPVPIWNAILKFGQCPPNGLDGVLLTGTAMKKRKYLLDCLREGPRLMLLWQELLRPLSGEDDWQVGAFRDKGLSVRPLAAADFLWQQIDWFRLLNEEGDALADEELHQAVTRLLANEGRVEAIAAAVPSSLLQRYQSLMARLHGA